MQRKYGRMLMDFPERDRPCPLPCRNQQPKHTGPEDGAESKDEDPHGGALDASVHPRHDKSGHGECGAVGGWFLTAGEPLVCPEYEMGGNSYPSGWGSTTPGADGWLSVILDGRFGRGFRSRMCRRRGVFHGAGILTRGGSFGVSRRACTVKGRSSQMAHAAQKALTQKIAERLSQAR